MKKKKLRNLCLVLAIGFGLSMSAGNLWAITIIDFTDPDFRAELLVSTYTDNALLPSGLPMLDPGETGYVYTLENTGIVPIHILEISPIDYNDYGFVMGSGDQDPDPVSAVVDLVQWNFLGSDGLGADELSAGEISALLYVYSDVGVGDDVEMENAIAAVRNTVLGGFGFIEGPTIFGVDENPQTNDLPEPTTLFLLGSGLFGLGIYRIRFRKK